MGILRGGLLVIFSVLFLFSLIVQGFFLTVYLSLDYNSVKPELSLVVSDLIKEEKNAYEFLEGKEELIENKISEEVGNKYYKEYDCGFWDCIQKTKDPFSLISKNAQDYWKNKFLSFLIVCLVLAVVVFLLVEHKSNFFILSSFIFGLASLCFLKLDGVADLILKPFFSIGEKLGDLPFSSFLELFSVFLAKSSAVFYLFFVIGISFLVIWIIIEVFKAGFEIPIIIEKISGWFKKETDQQPQKDFLKKVNEKKTIKKN